MTKCEIERRISCSKAGCKYFYRCSIFWGKKCKHMCGNKIPRIGVRYKNTNNTPDDISPGKLICCI